MRRRGDITAEKIAAAIAEVIPTDIALVWKAVASVIEERFLLRFIEFGVDPTSGNGIRQRDDEESPGSPYPASTIGIQLDPMSYKRLAIWVNVDGSTKGWSRVWPAEVEPSVGFYPGPMKPVGADDPGSDPRPPRGDHSHPDAPQSDPATVASTLYPAQVPGPTTARPVKCILAPYSRWADCDAVFAAPGGGGEWAGVLFGGFTEGPLGTWTRNVTGTLPSSLIDDVTPVLGMRLFAGATYPGSSGPDADNLPLCGLYELIDTGETENPGGPDFVLHSATLRRVTDADSPADFTYGKPVHIKNGTLWANHTFRYHGVVPPVLGTSPLPFYDAGTSSIYRTGVYGFGSVLEHVAGVSTYHKVDEGMGFPAQPAGALFGLAADGSTTIPIALNDEFLVWLPTDTYGESPHFGVFKLISGYTDLLLSPVIARPTDANTPAELSAQVVKITGAGAWHEGDVFTQTNAITEVDVTATTWTIGPDSPPSEIELLTGPQLISEHATSDVVTAETGAISEAGLLQLSGSFGTLVGTPGVSEIPAALHTMRALVAVTGGDPATYAQLVAQLSLVDSSWVQGDSVPDPYLTMTSAPLYAGFNGIITFQGAPASPVTTAADKRLVLRLYASSTSTTTLHVLTLTWQNANRDTRLTVPFDLPVSGAATGRHPDLSLRDVANQHPRFSITDAEGMAALTGSGTTRALVLAKPFRTGGLTIATNEVLYAIDTTDWSDGQVLDLFVDGCSPSMPLTLVHLGGGTGEIYVGQVLATGAGQNAAFVRPVFLQFKRRQGAGHWRLINAKM